jgi:hypothetical protein
MRQASRDGFMRGREKMKNKSKIKKQKMKTGRPAGNEGV